MVQSNGQGSASCGRDLEAARVPGAAASIYQFFDREQANVELVSLSESALTAERNGRTRWTPGEAGVEFVILAAGT